MTRNQRKHQLFYADLGGLIRTRRNRLNMSQADLAERIGLTRPSVVNIEFGNHGSVSVHVLCAIADALCIPVHRLIPKGR